MNVKLSVTQINDYIKNLMESDILLQDIWIEGEIVNLKVYQFGKQVYFNLSDSHSSINCVLYSDAISRTKLDFKPGLNVRAKGKVKVFQRKGTYIFQINYLETLGKGDLADQFEKLKNKLKDEGLFDSERKKTVPKFPQHIGLITAPNSAAFWDFINITKRFNLINISFFPVIVQGLDSPASIRSALQDVLRYHVTTPLDLVVICRGGGSAEDLAGFNNEQLIRDLADFHLPFITGIGHDVDFTLTDFVADIRFATPTAAAKAIIENYNLTHKHLISLINRLPSFLNSKLDKSFRKVQDLCLHAGEALHEKYECTSYRFESLNKQLILLNPLSSFQKGYSIATSFENGSAIKSIKDVSLHAKIKTQFLDGFIISEVLEQYDN